MSSSFPPGAQSYVTFLPGPPKPKTKTWRVLADDGTDLGEIFWFGRWRCYAFGPERGMVFERRCLRDIAAFCEEETKRHRERRSEAQP